MMENICPVCEYKGLYAQPYDKHGRGSDEICPCCGFHFGLDDFKGKEEAFVKWRNKWARNGCKWFSKFRLPPPDFNPVVLTLDFDEPDEPEETVNGANKAQETDETRESE